MIQDKAQSAGNGMSFSRAATRYWIIRVAPFGRAVKRSSAVLRLLARTRHYRRGAPGGRPLHDSLNLSISPCWTTRFVVAILLFVIFAMPLVAPAGDEVDYSAPYLVVEDGELVTKYPAKEHTGVSPEADAQASKTTESPQQQVGLDNVWAIAAVAIAVAIALLLSIKRGWQRRG